MPDLTWKQWVGFIAVVIVVTVATWIGLNVGKMLYQDWAFLHMIRVNTEAQQAHPQAPQQAPAPGAPAR